jgi:hypothetical protein
VEPNYWKGLRVIDTPGLEGFNARVREKALRWTDRSDVIAMVISDDHIEPILLERMAQIIRHNKPLIILLNIKCGNAERLLRHPELVFRPEEIEGHTQRIRRFLEDKFREYHTPLKTEAIPIFPYWADGAGRSCRACIGLLRFHTAYFRGVKMRQKDLIPYSQPNTGKGSGEG